MPNFLQSGSQQSQFSTAHQSYPYLKYSVEEEYEYSDGSLAIPVAYTTGQTPQPGQRQPQEIVQLSAPYSRRLVWFVISRLGALPVLPKPQANRSENLSFVKIKTKAPTLWTDGVSKVYSVMGVYVFDSITPTIPGVDPLSMGLSDADAANASNTPYTLPASQMSLAS